MPELNRQDRCVLDTLLPSGTRPDLPYGVFDADFDSFYDEFASSATFSMRLGFSAALKAASWVSPLLIFRLPPLSRLDRDDRERALAAMAGSRLYLLRQLVVILKAVSCFAYGADRRVRDAVGYPRQPDAPAVPWARPR